MGAGFVWQFWSDPTSSPNCQSTSLTLEGPGDLYLGFFWDNLLQKKGLVRSWPTGPGGHMLTGLRWVSQLGWFPFGLPSVGTGHPLLLMNQGLIISGLPFPRMLVGFPLVFWAAYETPTKLLVLIFENGSFEKSSRCRVLAKQHSFRQLNTPRSPLPSQHSHFAGVLHGIEAIGLKCLVSDGTSVESPASAAYPQPISK